MNHGKKDNWKHLAGWTITSILGFIISHHNYMHAENFFSTPVHLSLIHLTQIHYY